LDMDRPRSQKPRSTNRDWRSALLPFVISFAFLALYGATLLPDVLPADEGEFQLVARTAGVAHPPGYPLYTMVAWLFAHMPVGPSPAWRVNLFSALTAAATLGLVSSTARRLTDSVLGGLAATLTLGSATTFWATATKASIRPLTAFFTALCLYALAQYTSHLAPRSSDDARRTAGSRRDRYLVLLALALSLGLTHHPSLVFPAAVFGLYLVLIDPALLRQPRRWLKPAVAFALGLAVLIYLPLRGAPDLATLSGFLDHVLARGFRGDMFALNLLDRLVLLPTLLRFQFNWVLLLGMLVGALLLLWHDGKLALLLLGSFAVYTAVTLTYDAPQTVEYEMPAYVSLALLVAVPFGPLAASRSESRGSTSSIRDLQLAVRLGSLLLAAVLLLAVVFNLLAHLPSYDALSRSHDARDYAEKVLNGAPENAVILSNWHWFSPLRYLQQVEEVRLDVEVEYVAPGGEPLARTWVRAIEEHIDERPVVVARTFENEYRDLPYRFEPLEEAFLVRREPRAEIPAGMIALDVTLGERIRLRGYRLGAEETEPAQPVTVTLAWSPVAVPREDLALFAQLIGPDGRLWSAAQDPRHPTEALASDEVVLDRFVVYPFLHAAPGDYTLAVGAYLPDGRLTTADGLDAVPLDTVTLRPSTTRPVTEHPRFVRFGGGPTLIGADYDIGVDGQPRTYLHWAGPGESTYLQLTSGDDAALTTGRVPALKRGQYATIALDRPMVPTRLAVLGEEGTRRWNLLFGGPIRLPSPKRGERYIPLGDAMILSGFDGPVEGLEPGREVTLHLRFRGQRPLERDYVVSVALTGLNADATWAWRASDDTVPALGAIPTLKWIRGSKVLDPHRMTIPVDASDVSAVGSFVVYDHFTQRLLPPLDERTDSARQLGTWDLVPR
jgi:hypothetical protein